VLVIRFTVMGCILVKVTQIAKLLSTAVKVRMFVVVMASKQ
jgi:hypothetical protein